MKEIILHVTCCCHPGKAPHMQKGPAIKEGRVLSTTIERYE